MNIGIVAKKSGLDAKTIRYYESIELVTLPLRGANGYREYSEENLQELVFLRHARQFGFSIEECRQLLNLWLNPARQSAEVHALVTEKVDEIEKRIRELKRMKKLLTQLMSNCADDENPECVIIDTLASL